MLEPKEITLDLPGGGTKTYILTKFDCWTGREICTQYPLSALPKIGEYGVNEDMALKIMKFVGVRNNDATMMLETKDLVRNHVVSWETLVKLEAKMIEYNCSFFLDGSASTFLSALADKLPEKIIAILTRSLAPLFQAAKPPSTN